MSTSVEERLCEAIERFMRNPADLSSRTSVLELISELDDGSDVVANILSGGRIKIAQPGEEVVGVVGTWTTDNSDVKTANLIAAIGDNGGVFTEHFYFAAECAGKAKIIDQKLVQLIITALLHEFDLELAPPQRAIQAFGHLGDRAVPFLMNYIKNRSRETFSREDAALSLGKIGTNLVVEELTEWLNDCESGDEAMPIYALGFTRNVKAISVVENWISANPTHGKMWVATDALSRLK